MLPGIASPGGPPKETRPRWLVCEDGHEYTRRLERFLGTEFRFQRVTDAAGLLEAVAAGDVTGVVMDLDFRRTPPERLVDEDGDTQETLSPAEQRRLAELQGILILRVLRRQGSRLPVVLCADLDDPGQVAFLERTLAPLAVAPSSESLTRLAARLLAAGTTP